MSVSTATELVAAPTSWSARWKRSARAPLLRRHARAGDLGGSGRARSRRSGCAPSCPSGFAADGYARERAAGAAPALHGPGAQLADRADGERQRPRARGGDLEPDPARPDRPRSRFLHDLPDQLASFEPIVTGVPSAESADGLAELVADAWRVALTPPTGLVYLEVPVDVLDGPTGAAAAPGLDAEPAPLPDPAPEASGRGG